MSAENSTWPFPLRGARSISAIPRLPGALGSTSKWARATMRSYAPVAPNDWPLSRSPRSTSSTRVTAANETEQKKTCNSLFNPNSSFLLVRSLLLRNHDPVRQRRQFPHFVSCETGAAAHRIQFRKRIGVAILRRSQHDHAERRMHGRGDAVLIGNEFERHHHAAWFQRRMDLLQKLLALRHVEVMQEV